MSNSVNGLANSYADRRLAHQQINENDRVLFRKRIVYDFSVTGFNVCTAASIVAIALAIFVGSPLFVFLALVIYGSRRAFMKELGNTALPEDVLRQPNINHLNRRDDIADHLEIDEANWTPIQTQFLDFRIWMNWTPPIVNIHAQQQE